MNENSILPTDFDGVFRFTNFTETEFVGKWGGIEYIFPALSTSPMVIPNATPEEVQHIRKKFAKDLAIQEFYKTQKFDKMNAHVPGGSPALYTDSDLAPFVQKCLEPLPVKMATLKTMPKDTEERYKKDNKGRNVTKILEEGEELVGNGNVIG